MALHLALVTYDSNIALISYITVEVETCTVDKTEYSEYSDCCHYIGELIDGNSETTFTHYYYWQHSTAELLDYPKTGSIR